MEPTLGLFDTNIVIDLLSGVDQAREEIQSYKVRAISLITWIEVMVGATPDNEQDVREALADFTILPISPHIAEETVKLRRRKGLKLPDAMILATAIVGGGVFITRDTKHFPKDKNLIRNPYKL
jgi:predicted nucleic acid-binding protein